MRRTTVTANTAAARRIKTCASGSVTHSVYISQAPGVGAGRLQPRPAPAYTTRAEDRQPDARASVARAGLLPNNGAQSLVPHQSGARVGHWRKPLREPGAAHS